MEHFVSILDFSVHPSPIFTLKRLNLNGIINTAKGLDKSAEDMIKVVMSTLMGECR